MSENTMIAVIMGGFFAVLMIGLVAGSWLEVEKARTERARIEHGCATPTPEVER